MKRFVVGTIMSILVLLAISSQVMAKSGCQAAQDALFGAMSKALSGEYKDNNAKLGQYFVDLVEREYAALPPSEREIFSTALHVFIDWTKRGSPQSVMEDMWRGLQAVCPGFFDRWKIKR